MAEERRLGVGEGFDHSVQQMHRDDLVQVAEERRLAERHDSFVQYERARAIGLPTFNYRRGDSFRVLPGEIRRNPVRVRWG